MRYRQGLLGLCAFGVATIAGAGQAQDRAPAPSIGCKLEAIGAATVKTVTDGRTLGLADGREIRLAGLETPTEGPAAAMTAATLKTLLSGRDVTLKRLSAEHDRYGRLLAYVVAAGQETPVQHALLAAGHARVSAWIGDAACAAELARIERIARDARLGVWSDPHYVIYGADEPAAVLLERGRFTLVEGRVLSVRESGGTIYVNFGRRWTEDFTVTIAKRSERLFAAAGLELKKLSGRRVRVRGVIEERGGPWIEAVRPEQIEVTGN